ncbi:MAG: response regulator [Pseudomonadota bacterium]
MSVSPQENASFAIRRLAIIDDAEFDQMLYARLVKRSGLVGELLSFFSAEEALEYFEQPGSLPVDAILLDINMPGMSGFEFLEYVTANRLEEYANVVIVMLTTSLDPADVTRAEQFELVKEYINKPLEAQHLARIHKLLQHSKGAAP